MLHWAYWAATEAKKTTNNRRTHIDTLKQELNKKYIKSESGECKEKEREERASAGCSGLALRAPLDGCSYVKLSQMASIVDTTTIDGYCKKKYDTKTTKQNNHDTEICKYIQGAVVQVHWDYR